MSLFRLGDHALSSGQSSDWKVDCDALTGDDLRALALVGARIIGPFGRVFGVPTGGLRFADAMRAHADPLRSFAILIVDDVLTTGASMEATAAPHRFHQWRTIMGLVIFARGPCPPWVRAVWTLDERGQNR